MMLASLLVSWGAAAVEVTEALNYALKPIQQTTTWQQAYAEACPTGQGLCFEHQICPNGAGGAPIYSPAQSGAIWVPTGDGYNHWVSLDATGDTLCMAYHDYFSDWGKPGWGKVDQPLQWRQLALCCPLVASQQWVVADGISVAISEYCDEENDFPACTEVCSAEAGCRGISSNKKHCCTTSFNHVNGAMETAEGGSMISKFSSDLLTFAVARGKYVDENDLRCEEIGAIACAQQCMLDYRCKSFEHTHLAQNGNRCCLNTADSSTVSLANGPRWMYYEKKMPEMYSYLMTDSSIAAGAAKDCYEDYTFTNCKKLADDTPTAAAVEFTNNPSGGNLTDTCCILNNTEGETGGVRRAQNTFYMEKVNNRKIDLDVFEWEAVIDMDLFIPEGVTSSVIKCHTTATLMDCEKNCTDDALCKSYVFRETNPGALECCLCPEAAERTQLSLIPRPAIGSVPVIVRTDNHLYHEKLVKPVVEVMYSARLQTEGKTSFECELDHVLTSCSAACAAKERCTAYAYYHVDFECCFYDDSEIQQIKDANYFSQAEEAELHFRGTFAGATDQTESIMCTQVDLVECFSLCYNQETCMGFTFPTEAGAEQCCLKSQTLDMGARFVADSTLMFWEKGAKPDRGIEFQVIPNAMIPGDDIECISANWWACAGRCKRMDRCRSFDHAEADPFDSAAECCLQNSAPGDPGTDVAFDYYRTLYVKVPEESLHFQYRVALGKNIHVEAPTCVDNLDIQECGSRCSRAGNCKSFGYDTQSKSCCLQVYSNMGDSDADPPYSNAVEFETSRLYFSWNYFEKITNRFTEVSGGASECDDDEDENGVPNKALTLAGLMVEILDEFTSFNIPVQLWDGQQVDPLTGEVDKWAR